MKLHQSNEIVDREGKILRFEAFNSSCPVCGQSCDKDLVHKFSPRLDFDIVKCANCQTMHLWPVPDSKSLETIYNTNYYKDPEEAHGYTNYSSNKNEILKTYQKRFNFLKKHCLTGNFNSTLEIGAALGYGLAQAQKFFGGTVIAADISEEAISACKKANFPAFLCEPSGICNTIDSNSLDLVYAFDVIEHLTNTQKFVEWLGNVIRPGGICFVTTPDMDHILNKILGSRSPSIKIPQHVVYFTKKSLIHAFSEKFDFVKSSSDFQYVKFGDFFNRLLHILNLKRVKLNSGPVIAVPNGMQMFIFKRNCK